MAAINVRDLPEHVHRCLRIRAARAGRSMEAEVRAILAEVCSADARPSAASEVQEWVARLYKGKPPHGAVDELIRSRRREARKE